MALNVSALIPRHDESKSGIQEAHPFSSHAKLAINSLALAAQVTGFVVWPLLEIEEKPRLWALPLATILISCGWWENFYVTAKNSSKSLTIKHPHFCLQPLYSYI
jgi:hypothetical protein